MKFLSVIALFFVIAACENRNTIEPQEKTLAGKWEWVQSVGGIGGWTYKASATEKKQVIYTTGGDFELIENGQSKTKKKYEIKDGPSITSTEKVPVIYYLPEGSIAQSYRVKSDTLYLFDEVNDGFNHVYVRVK